MAKREVWVVEDKTGKPLCAKPTKDEVERSFGVGLGEHITRYVPDEPEAEGWEAWAVVSKRGALRAAYPKRLLAGYAVGAEKHVVKVRVVPVEVKARKRKEGA